jgi:membrane protease YdiL (CAAX protease family)
MAWLFFNVGALAALVAFFAVFLAPFFGRFANAADQVVLHGLSLFVWFLLQCEYRARPDQVGLTRGAFGSARVWGWALFAAGVDALPACLVASAYYLLNPTARSHSWAFAHELASVPRDRLIFAATFGVLIAPVTEEVLCRGYFYLILRQNWGGRAAALISSAAFALMHVGHGFGCIWIFAISLVYVYANNRARSLVPSLASHVAGNALVLLLAPLRFCADLA